MGFSLGVEGRPIWSGGNWCKVAPHGVGCAAGVAATRGFHGQEHSWQQPPSLPSR